MDIYLKSRADRQHVSRSTYGGSRLQKFILEEPGVGFRSRSHPRAPFREPYRLKISAGPDGLPGKTPKLNPQPNRQKKGKAEGSNERPGLTLVTMMHTSTSVKEESDVSTRDKTNEDNEDSSDYNEEEWDEFFKDVQRKIDEEDRKFTKGKRLMKSASTTRQYTRRRNVQRSASQHSGPLTRARSLSGILQTESPWVAGPDAPSASTQRPSHSKTRTTETEILESIRREQQRLSATQERISKELQQISSEHKKIKKKYSNIKNLLKGILSKLSCTSSDSSD